MTFVEYLHYILIEANTYTQWRLNPLVFDAIPSDPDLVPIKIQHIIQELYHARITD